MTLVDIKDRSPNPELIRQLEEMLEEARTGEVRTLLGVWGWGDGSVSSGWAIDPRQPCRAVLGEFSMLQAKFVQALREADRKAE